MNAAPPRSPVWARVWHRMGRPLRRGGRGARRLGRRVRRTWRRSLRARRRGEWVSPRVRRTWRRSLRARRRGEWVSPRVRALMILRPPISVRGVRLRVRRTVSNEMRRAMYTGEYERREIDLVDEFLEPHDRVMELGGGLGVISAFCARRVGSENVVTYEGNPALEPYIRETWEANDVSPRLVPALIGAEAGERSFYIGKSTWDASLLPGKEKLPRRLPVRGFNEERRRFDPTFVVMDIEGTEYEVVQGADWGNVRGLVLEAHPGRLGPEKTKTLGEWLARAGFVLRREEHERYLYFSREPA